MAKSNLFILPNAELKIEERRRLKTTNVIEQFNGILNMKINNNVEEQEIVARFAKAMGHPTRVAILLFLASQESCFFGDIHDELPIAKATVSQHLKELKEAGLIQGEIETPKVRYCINKENWEIASKLFADLFSVYATKDICC
jgi:DNA-binding transcriptional ArsR family regulator